MIQLFNDRAILVGNKSFQFVLLVDDGKEMLVGLLADIRQEDGYVVEFLQFYWLDGSIETISFEFALVRH